MWKNIRKYLSRIDLRIAVKTGIAASCSFYAASWYTKYLDRPDSLASGLWCVVTAIVVMQSNIGTTYKAGMNRLLGIVIGSIVGGFLTESFGAEIVALGAGVSATIFICSLLQLKDSYRIAGLSVAIVMLSWAAHPISSPWTVSFFRSLDSTIGILIAIIVSHLVWPEQTWMHIKNQFQKAVHLAKKSFHETVNIQPQKNPSMDMQELFNLLVDLHNELEDTKLDFFTFSSERENWLLAVQGLDSVAESIAIIRGIPKSNFVNLFDESLKQHLEAFINDSESSFEDILEICVENVPAKPEDLLEDQEQVFWQDLERFRNTRTTRNFSLTDVESFYSYFYHLRFISRQLRLMKQYLHTVLD